MDFAKSFKFVFEDPDWLKKIGLVSLITLIPVVGMFVLMGYALETAQRVIRQDPEALPALDFGAQLGLGFKGFVINFAYGIPMFLLYLPVIISTATMSSDSGDLSPLVMGLMICCGGLMFLYAIALAIFLPAAIGNFLATGQIGSAFRFSEIIALVRAAPSTYLLVLVGVLAANFIGSLGSIACGIGIIFTFSYGMVVAYHLYGQAYRVSISNGALRI
jgi:hypothetical protein